MSVSSILGVIVLYENEFEQTKTYQSLLRGLINNSEHFEILLYDNSTQPQYHAKYFEINNFKVNYIHDSSNPGIGKAYNVGAGLAKKLHKDWMLLLDQDTEFPKTIFESYLKAIHANPNINLFAPILKLSNDSPFSPSKYVFKRGFKVQNIKIGINSLKYLSPVNSGMLVKTEAFLRVGGYNERIKLDFSDFQFIEKFKITNKQFFLLDEICLQDFSNTESNLASLEKRFNIYCNDARNCQSFSFFDPFFYFTNSLLRAIKLTFRTNKKSFIKIWIANFIYNASQIK